MEDHVTHHIQAVLGGLYRACQDEEKIVSEEAVKSANLIGIYMCILICICVVIICIIYIYIYIYSVLARIYLEWWLNSTLHLVLFIQYILNSVSVAYI